MARVGNDEVLSVDQLFLDFTDEQTGQVEQIPAIDERWVASMEWGRFRVLTDPSMVACETFLEEMAVVLEATSKLRELDYHVFWSTVLYDSDALDMIDSFLLHCPRRTDADLYTLMWGGCSGFSSKAEPGVRDMMVALHRDILLVVVRLATPKESAERFMSAEFFGDLIYDRDVFTVSRLMNVCALYGPAETRLVGKIVESLLKYSPLLLDAISDHCAAVINMLESVASEAERSARERTRPRIQGSEWERVRADVDEMCAYLVDAAATLAAFAKADRRVARRLHDGNLVHRLPELVNRIYQPLYRHLTDRKDMGGFGKTKKRMIGQLQYFVEASVRLYREMLTATCLRCITVDACNKSIEELSVCAVEFMRHISDLLTSEQFIWYYDDKFPIKSDVEKLQAMQAMDEAQASFVLTGVDKNKEQLGTNTAKQLAAQGILKGIGTSTDSNLQAKIAQIREIFHDLPADYVHLCLRHYRYRCDELTDALLQQTLPAQLKQCRHVARLAAFGTPDGPPPPPVDLMNFSADEQRVSSDAPPPVAALLPIDSGKKHNEPWLAAARQELHEMKPLYERYQMETPREGEQVDDNIALYDDEYDDTYDGVEMSCEPSSTDDYIKQRRLNTAPPLPPAEGAPRQHGQAQAQGQQASVGSSSYTGGRQRQLAERNKSKAAHHDRKNQAAKKYNKGMF